MVPEMPENREGKEVGVYAPDGLMPELFLWLSPEMQQERATLLSELGVGQVPLNEGVLSQELREDGRQARRDERSGGYPPKQDGA